jgi:hypothetical protein
MRLKIPENPANTRIGRHGAATLPAVNVDCYNVELKDEDGFLGDRASKGAFPECLAKPLKKTDDDPFDNKCSENIPRKELDKILVSDDLDAPAILHSAVEGFAQALAGVIRRRRSLASRATGRLQIQDTRASRRHSTHQDVARLRPKVRPDRRQQTHALHKF